MVAYLGLYKHWEAGYTVVGLRMKEGIEQIAATLELAFIGASQWLASLVLSTDVLESEPHPQGPLRPICLY